MITTMCGRYVLYDTDEINERFAVSSHTPFDMPDSYNIAPSQIMPVIYQKNGTRILQPMQWGFVPFWSKDPSQEIRPINTKSETAFASRMWSDAVKKHRCLVPARGFYEWKRLNNANGRSIKKQPYYIHPKDQDLFAFAGVYSVWQPNTKDALFTYSIMTTQPNKELATIHNRMPVILSPGTEALWLDPDYAEQAVLSELLAPYKDSSLELTPTSKAVNSPKNNGRELIK
jgi:putative SOS response-associated peptidase YedK